MKFLYTTNRIRFINLSDGDRLIQGAEQIIHQTLLRILLSFPLNVFTESSSEPLYVI